MVYEDRAFFGLAVSRAQRLPTMEMANQCYPRHLRAHLSDYDDIFGP